MLTRAQAAKGMAEPSPSEGGGKASSVVASTTSSQRASLVARQKAAEAKYRRKIAELTQHAVMAEEAAARAELEAETAAVEAEEALVGTTAASMERTAEWVGKARSAEGSPSRLMDRQSPTHLSPRCDRLRSPCVVSQVPKLVLSHCENVHSTTQEKVARAMHPIGEGVSASAKVQREFPHSEAPSAKPRDEVPASEIIQLANAITLLAQNNSARSIVNIDIVNFSGDVTEWLPFKRSFDDTRSSFSAKENMARLRKAVCGVAREAVRTLLLSSDEPDLVLKALELRFARPEQIVLNEIAMVRALPKLRNPNEIFTFASKVQSCLSIIKQLNKNEYIYSPEIVHTLLAKLTFNLQDKWLDFADKNFDPQTPMLELLATFLEQEASKHARFSPSPLLSGGAALVTDRPKTQPAFHRVHANSIASPKCLYCQSNHSIKSCPQFLFLSIDERWSWVRQSNICPKCFRKGKHNWRTCRAKSCNKCSLNHHHLLHSDSSHSNENNSTNRQCQNHQNIPTSVVTRNSLPSVTKNSPSHNVSINDNRNRGMISDQEVCVQPATSTDNACNATSFSVKDKSSYRVLLKIVPVVLSGPGGEVHTYALLDDGSTTTLLDSKLSDALGLDGANEEVFMSGVTGSRKINSKRVTFNIRGRNTSEVFNISDARTVPDLSLASQSVRREDFSSYSYLSDIADGLSFEQATPRVLIGICDWHLLVSLENRFGSSPSQPAAIRTALGWVIYGCQPKFSKNIPTLNHCLVTDSDEELNSLIRDYYKLESIGIRHQQPYTTQEQRAVRIVEETTRRLPNGRFEVGLPWREDNPRLPDSYHLALSRLNSLLRRFRRDSDYVDLYTKNIQAYVDKGYAEECTDSHKSHDDTKRWYLPHFGVTNVNKPGKLRIVHDAAALTHGVCLNSLLLPGPDLLQSLLGVLMKFREGQVALTGDIREMFPQIKIRREDLDCQRYLWRSDFEDPVREFRMTSLIFGASCSPFIAIYIKNRNAREFESEYPEASRDIVECHYMDDYLGSYDSVEDAARVAADIVHVHSQCGFEMRSWVSNNTEALKLLPPSLVKEEIREVDLNFEGVGMRVLGLHWVPHADRFIFKINFCSPDLEALTKRQALRDLMKIFDPLGFLAPIITTGKILFQRTWQLVREWDDVLPSAERSRWGEWYNSVASLGSLSIPRCYTDTVGPVACELHTFSDASNQAYACVSYWRFIFADGSVKVAFIMGKSRVAPLKPTSVPRLELQAALLGVRLATTICEQHRIKPSKRFFWCDSQTVLAWIRSAVSDSNTFVRNRIGEIAELTQAHEWFWIPTELNVADDATRVASTGVESLSRWLQGPDILLRNQLKFPAEPSNSVEIKTFVTLTPTIIFNLVHPNCKLFSSWIRLLRATARAHQFLRLLREKAFSKRPRQRGGPRPLLAADMKSAELHILRQSQQESLSVSCFEHLQAKQDSLGLYRLHGRIAAASDVAEDVKQPVILNGSDHVTRLIVHHYHVWAGHAGREMVVNELRQRYWIIRLRPTVRTVAAACQVCRNKRATASVPPVGNLPEERLLHHQRPFSITGLDYFGPVEVAVGRRREKRWVALFTCFSTRAVHLEVVGSLSADSAIMALRRFMSRRGCPQQIFSDNGTSFVGANREIQREWQTHQPAISDFMSNQQIEWHFLPPSAPFMGGVWERLVGCVKRTLSATLKERAPREEVFNTLLLEAEGIVNSRPMTHVPVEPRDAPALTPNHFLIGQSSPLPRPDNLDDSDLVRRANWKKAVRLADHFWQRWVREYLPILNPRRDAGAAATNLETGDLVLICDANLPRGVWPKGRVDRVYPGRDGIVRVADVRTVGGTLRRPVRKLVRLSV